MDSLVLGLLTGGLAGALMSRHSVCLNAGLRRAVFDRKPTVLRIFGLAVAVQLLVLPLLFLAGVGPLERNIDLGAPALLPVAQLTGGIVFGVGMALAGGCITGILWKSGAGSIAAGLAIAGFAAGELLIRGPGESVIADLDDAASPGEGSLADITGLPFELIAPVIGAIALVLMVGRKLPDGFRPGVALGLLAAAAWVVADVVGYGYGLGFVGWAEGARVSIADGTELPFQLWLAAGVVAGGTLGARGPLRLPDAARATRALGGGVLMGVGGSIAHGCNIGHGVTGVALLSVGSMLAITTMGLSALLTWRLVLRDRPAVRGAEHPDASSAW